MNKLKTTGFWISLTGAVILVLQVIGGAFGFKINSELINNLVSSICGVLVIVGVLIPSKQENNKINFPTDSSDENLNSSNQQEENETCNKTKNEDVLNETKNETLDENIDDNLETKTQNKKHWRRCKKSIKT